MRRGRRRPLTRRGLLRLWVLCANDGVLLGTWMRNVVRANERRMR